WRRSPRSLALLLRLLALAAGAVALAQPARLEVGGRQLVYILDAAPSMQATDVQPTRFEAARSAIRTELSRLRSGDRASIIRLGARPELLVTDSDPAALTRALEVAAPGVEATSLRDALALAAQRFERPIAEGSEIVVFSDGTFDEPLDRSPLAVPVRFVKLAESGSNQGVS